MWKSLKNIFNFIGKESLSGSNGSMNLFNAKNLLCGIGKSEIGEKEIIIGEYPFEPSIAYPTAMISANDIECMAVDFGVGKIHIKDDIIFVSAEQKETLKQFAESNNIRLIRQSWNWDWILEPYLDTEFTKDNEKRCLERLIENGFSPTEVDDIRNEVKDQMYAYNFDTMLWDWCSLSLPDVLSAMRAKYSKEEFRKFYKRALEIEKRKKM
jgi:dipeptidase